MSADQTTRPPVDVDNLPPTQYLILEVLAARYRTGETYWTFPDKCAPAARTLERAGLIWLRSGPVERCFEARFTDAGRAAALSGTYVTPNERAIRDRVVAELVTVLEGVWVGDPTSNLYTAGKHDGYQEAAGTVRHHYERQEAQR